MARLRDLKVGMEVCVSRPRTNRYSGQTGKVVDITYYDCQVLVRLTENATNYWFYDSELDIIENEGETKMAQKTKVKQEVTPQKYVLIDDNDHSPIFTDMSANGICKVSNDEWGFEMNETINRLNSGKMKLFKIDEVKLEITEPSIKIVG